MTNIDGDWDCVTATPMGEQRFTMSVKRTGDGFVAHSSGAMGTIEVTDGTVEGDTIAWSMEVTSPFPMRLSGKATVTGDRIEGGITAGAFGTFPLEGTRL
jgi:hypothetical protein